MLVRALQILFVMAAVVGMVQCASPSLRVLAKTHTDEIKNNAKAIEALSGEINTANQIVRESLQSLGLSTTSPEPPSAGASTDESTDQSTTPPDKHSLPNLIDEATKVLKKQTNAPSVLDILIGTLLLALLYFLSRWSRDVLSDVENKDTPVNGHPLLLIIFYLVGSLVCCWAGGWYYVMQLANSGETAVEFAKLPSWQRFFACLDSEWFYDIWPWLILWLFIGVAFIISLVILLLIAFVDFAVPGKVSLYKKYSLIMQGPAWGSLLIRLSTVWIIIAIVLLAPCATSRAVGTWGENLFDEMLYTTLLALFCMLSVGVFVVFLRDDLPRIILGRSNKLEERDPDDSKSPTRPGM